MMRSCLPLHRYFIAIVQNVTLNTNATSRGIDLFFILKVYLFLLLKNKVCISKLLVNSGWIQKVVVNGVSIRLVLSH